MINQTLNTPFFYFSYTYDLTHTLQRLSAMGPNFHEVKNSGHSNQIGFEYVAINQIIFYVLDGYGATSRPSIHVEWALA